MEVKSPDGFCYVQSDEQKILMQTTLGISSNILQQCSSSRIVINCVEKIRNLKWLLVLGPTGDGRHGAIVSTKWWTDN